MLECRQLARRSNMAKIKKLNIELIFEYDKNEVKSITVSSPFNDTQLHDRIVRVITDFVKEQIGLKPTYIQ